MSTSLQEFDRAAGEIESLLAVAAMEETRRDAEAIARWVLRAQTFLSGTTGFLERCDPDLAALRGTPPVQRYRRQLELLGQTVLLLQQQLLARSADLHGESHKLNRVRAWTDVIGRLS